MIIGITGKMGSGKDTIGKIIQYLIVKTRKFYNSNRRSILSNFT